MDLAFKIWGILFQLTNICKQAYTPIYIVGEVGGFEMNWNMPNVMGSQAVLVLVISNSTTDFRATARTTNLPLRGLTTSNKNQILFGISPQT